MSVTVATLDDIAAAISALGLDALSARVATLEARPIISPVTPPGRHWAFFANEGGNPPGWAAMTGGWTAQPIDGLHTQTDEVDGYWFGDGKTWVPTPARFMMSNQFTAPSFDMAKAAAGAYDVQWLGWLTSHASVNVQVVRIWQEINGNWMPWSQGTPAQIIAAWRNMATQVRAVFPKAVIEWNVNAGGPWPNGPSQPNNAGTYPFDLYPGDDLVDVIGIDSYQKDTPWATLLSGPGVNLTNLAAFAVAHNKLVGVSETAAHACDSSYITNWTSWLDTLGPRAAYFSYYDQGTVNRGDNVLYATTGPDSCAANTLRAALNASSFRLPYVGTLGKGLSG